MARIYFEKKDEQLILHYVTENDWLEDRLEIEVFNTFKLSKRGLISQVTKTDYEYAFSFGTRENNYYRIPQEKIGCTFDLYIEHTLCPDESWFVTTSSPSKKYKDKAGYERTTSIYGNIVYVFKILYHILL